MRPALAGLILFLTLTFPAGASPAGAVTLPELVALSRAGLPDEVLLALIEVEARVFPVDADTIRWLHESGLSARVIEAIVRSGRTRAEGGSDEPRARPGDAGAYQAPAETPEDAPPQVVVIEREAPPVVVTVPVYVAVPVVAVPRERAVVRRAGLREVVVGSAVHAPVVSTGFGAPHTSRPPGDPPAHPVYWGWGGRLRPDAWAPAWEAGKRQAQSQNRK